MHTLFGLIAARIYLASTSALPPPPLPAALKVGDAILSINDVVPSSPKHAVSLILEHKGMPVKFVLVESSETSEAPAYRHR